MNLRRCNLLFICKLFSIKPKQFFNLEMNEWKFFQTLPFSVDDTEVIFTMSYSTNFLSEI